MARNPYYKPNQQLAITDASWAALKSKIQTYCQTNANKQALLDADVRAQDAQLADDRVWNQLKTEMGL